MTAHRDWGQLPEARIQAPNHRDSSAEAPFRPPITLATVKLPSTERLLLHMPRAACRPGFAAAARGGK